MTEHAVYAVYDRRLKGFVTDAMSREQARAWIVAHDSPRYSVRRV